MNMNYFKDQLTITDCTMLNILDLKYLGIRISCHCFLMFNIIFGSLLGPHLLWIREKLSWRGATRLKLSPIIIGLKLSQYGAELADLRQMSFVYTKKNASHPKYLQSGFVLKTREESCVSAISKLSDYIPAKSSTLNAT